MNILLTNDDGINSDGIQKLAQKLSSNGKHRVFVIAPESNRSGISHAVSFFSGPLKISCLGENNWSCSGYPADCVIAAVNGILPVVPDLVLSGINRGSNLGIDIIYSGTAAAARQASLFGIPAIALSLAGAAPFCWDMAASWTVDHLEEILAYWKEHSFVNVNIPNGETYPSGITLASPSAKNHESSLSIMTAPDGTLFCFLEGDEHIRNPEPDSDYDVVYRRFVSVTPVYNHPMLMKE